MKRKHDYVRWTIYALICAFVFSCAFNVGGGLKEFDEHITQ